jgi:hypothetical protein
VQQISAVRIIGRRRAETSQTIVARQIAARIRVPLLADMVYPFSPGVVVRKCADGPPLSRGCPCTALSRWYCGAFTFPSNRAAPRPSRSSGRRRP